MRSLWVVSAGFAASMACSPATPSTVEPPVPPESASVAHSAAPPATVSAAPAQASSSDPPSVASKPERTCGALGCRLFDTPQEAFAEVLKGKPRIIGIGETHAQKGSEAVASTTKRFTEILLPILAGQSSDLVLELWVADGSCGKQKEQKVAKEQKQVTEKQADTNQNEFVTLGNKAVSLGIKPHVLKPGCDDYDRIVKAGPDGVPLMLSMITRLTSQKVRDLLQRNDSAGSPKMVIAYGGAMHNDLVPKQGREEWSYGPEFSSLTSGKYVEIDLIVPQYIQSNASWQALAWFPHFDKEKNPDKVTLYQPSPGSYVLIFPSK
jgi:hypothetical protein